MMTKESAPIVGPLEPSKSAKLRRLQFNELRVEAEKLGLNSDHLTIADVIGTILSRDDENLYEATRLGYDGMAMGIVIPNMEQRARQLQVDLLDRLQFYANVLQFSGALSQIVQEKITQIVEADFAKTSSFYAVYKNRQTINRDVATTIASDSAIQSIILSANAENARLPQETRGGMVGVAMRALSNSMK